MKTLTSGLLFFACFLSACQAHSHNTTPTSATNTQDYEKNQQQRFKDMERRDIWLYGADFETKGQIDKAIECYKKGYYVYKLDECASSLASLYIKLEEYEKAKNFIDSILISSPKKVSILNEKAKLQQKTGDIENALKTLNFVLSIDQKNETAIRLKFDIFLQNKDWYNAYITYKDDLPSEKKYGTPDLRAMKMQLLNTIKSKLDFDPDKQQKIEASIANGDLGYFDIIKLAYESDSYMQKYLLTSKAIEIDPTHPSGYVLRILANVKTGNAEFAINDFNSILTLNKTNPINKTLMYLSYIYVMQAYEQLFLYTDAISAGESAIEISNDKEEILTLQSAIEHFKFLRDKGIKDKDSRYIANIEYYTKKIKENPDNANAYMQMGLQKLGLMDIEGALKDFRKSGELGNASAYALIGKIENIKTKQSNTSAPIIIEREKAYLPQPIQPSTPSYQPRDSSVEWALQGIQQELQNLNSTIRFK